MIKNEALIVCQKRFIFPIFLFHPLYCEPDLLDLMIDSPCDFALPRIDGKEMSFYKDKKGVSLLRNSYGIFEPQRDCSLILPDAYTLVCVPSLSCDPFGVRLGSGGGYYDRFMEKHPEPYYVGTLFEPFCMEKLLHDPWDQPVHSICTDQGIRPSLAQI